MTNQNCNLPTYFPCKNKNYTFPGLLYILKNPNTNCPTWNGFLVALIILVFGQSIYFDFVYYDDYTYTISKSTKGKFYSPTFLKWALTSTDDGFWAPLTKLSHQIDTNLFGAKPGWHHLVNLFLHITNSLLLWRLLTVFTGETLLAFLSTAIFAIHPLRTEPTCWIASRKDLLSTLFLLLMMIEFLKYIETSSGKNYFLCLLYFFLSALSKPISMVFPLMLPPLYLLYKKQIPLEIKYSSSIIKSTPFILTSILIAIVTLHSEQEAIIPNQFLTISERFSRCIISISHYFLLTFFPVELHTPFGIDYYLFSGQKFAEPVFKNTLYLLSFAILLATSTSIWITLSQNKLTGLTTYLMFIIPILPVSGIIPFGHHLIADRFTYPSHIAFALWLIHLPNHNEKPLKITYNTLLSIALIIFTVASFNLSSYWKNSETLFRRTLHYEPNSYVGLCNLASALLRNNRYAEAIPLLQKATELYPNRYEPYNDLAFAYQQQGRYQDALNYYLKSLQIKPDDPEILSNISALYLQIGNWENAKIFAQKALQINPSLNNPKKILNIIENHQKNSKISSKP